MDITVLTTFLTPFLPWFMELGSTAVEKTTETAAEKLGEASWTKAQQIWARLHPKIKAKPAAQEAAADVAHDPENADLQAALRVQLKKILDPDPELSQAIAQLLQAPDPAPPTTQINQTVTGNHNQIIGQTSGGTVVNVSGGTVTIGSPLPSDTSKPTPSPEHAPVKTILVLAANPKGTHPLRLSEEVRSLQTGLERSQYRDHFRLEQRWAVTPIDVRRALLDCQPQVVHFAGHGIGIESPDEPVPSPRDLGITSAENSPPEGLVFEDQMGQPQLVSSDAIANLFSLFADQIDCVLLNACYSATQADAIAQHIPYVVGMKRAIGDQAAIEFAIGFYDALLAGRPVDFAFQLGCAAIQMEGLPEHLTPTLKRKTT